MSADAMSLTSAATVGFWTCHDCEALFGSLGESDNPRCGRCGSNRLEFHPPVMVAA